MYEYLYIVCRSCYSIFVWIVSTISFLEWYIFFQHVVPLNVSSASLQWSNSTALSLSWTRPDSSHCFYAYSVSVFPKYNSSIQVNPTISGTTGKRLIFSVHFTN